MGEGRALCARRMSFLVFPFFFVCFCFSFLLFSDHVSKLPPPNHSHPRVDCFVLRLHYVVPLIVWFGKVPLGTSGARRLAFP